MTTIDTTQERSTIDPIAMERPATGDRPIGRAGMQRPLAGLFRELVDDVTTLIGKELLLARAEVAESIDHAKQGVGSMATGGAVLYAGVVLVLVAIAIFLAQYMPIWAAFLAVGVVTLIVGAIMLSAGKRRLEARAFVPERTLDALSRDQEMAKAKLAKERT